VHSARFVLYQADISDLDHTKQCSRVECTRCYTAKRAISISAVPLAVS
jgi:hypothetical protein